MSSRFAGLKTPAPTPPPVPPADAAPLTPRKALAREGKKAVVGYFSPALSKALGQLALDEDTTVQALVGEALDALMRARGKHPFGER